MKWVCFCEHVQWYVMHEVHVPNPLGHGLKRGGGSWKLIILKGLADSISSFVHEVANVTLPYPLL